MGTARLKSAFQVAVENAQTVFQKMLQRKQEAEKLRHVLGILKRFQFVIHLPATIRESIQKVLYFCYCLCLCLCLPLPVIVFPSITANYLLLLLLTNPFLLLSISLGRI
jgi:hypothetical protein